MKRHGVVQSLGSYYSHDWRQKVVLTQNKHVSNNPTRCTGQRLWTLSLNFSKRELFSPAEAEREIGPAIRMGTVFRASSQLLSLKLPCSLLFFSKCFLAYGLLLFNVTFYLLVAPLYLSSRLL